MKNADLSVREILGLLGLLAGCVVVLLELVPADRPLAWVAGLVVLSMIASGLRRWWSLRPSANADPFLALLLGAMVGIVAVAMAL